MCSLLLWRNQWGEGGVVVPQGGKFMCSLTVGKQSMFKNHQRKLPLLTFAQRRVAQALASSFVLVVNRQEIVLGRHSESARPVLNLWTLLVATLYEGCGNTKRKFLKKQWRWLKICKSFLSRKVTGNGLLSPGKQHWVLVRCMR